MERGRIGETEKKRTEKMERQRDKQYQTGKESDFKL
jgi:hypothetical protein